MGKQRTILAMVFLVGSCASAPRHQVRGHCTTIPYSMPFCLRILTTSQGEGLNG